MTATKIRYGAGIILAPIVIVGLLLGFRSLEEPEPQPVKAKATIETTTTTAPPTTTTTAVQEVPEPETITEIVVQDNPDLAKCAQALYDTQLSNRAYFDAIRSYQSGFEDLARQSEEEADRIYADIWQQFSKHCDKYVTDRRPSPWG